MKDPILRLDESIDNYIENKYLKKLSKTSDIVIATYNKKYTEPAKDESGNIIKDENGDVLRVLKSDIDFKSEADNIREKIKNGAKRDDILPDIYALVMAASEKVNGFHHRKCQMECGLTVTNGCIAELNTGEGKTLAATLPAVLNAFFGEPVIIVTENNYLAQVGANDNKPIYELLGFTTGCVLPSYDSNDNQKMKQENYNCDIVYSTINEVGFDYLRDNRVKDESQKVQVRGLSSLIIDEIDQSIIDNAITPLVLSEEFKSDDFKPNVYIANLITQSLYKLQDKKVIPYIYFSYDNEDDTNSYHVVLDDTNSDAILTNLGMKYVEGALREVVELINKLSISTDFLSDAVKKYNEDAKEYILKSKYLRTLINGDGEISNELQDLIESSFVNKLNKLRNDPENSKYVDRIFSIIKNEEEYEFLLNGFKKNSILAPFFDEVNKIPLENIDEYVSIDNNLMHFISNSLKTKFYLTDEHINNDGKIVLFDKKSGRIAEGRQYSQGLHQAIEAHENGLLGISNDSIPVATITINSLLSKFSHVAGMTGTAKQATNEFKNLYGLSVVKIAPHKPSQRIDEGDGVFLSKESKMKAIVEDILNSVDRGRPVLTCATTLEQCNEIKEALEKYCKTNATARSIPDIQLLTPETAPTLAAEAEIIAQAGKPGRVTIATNMAGRGTDIKLKQPPIVYAEHPMYVDILKRANNKLLTDGEFALYKTQVKSFIENGVVENPQLKKHLGLKQIKYIEEELNKYPEVTRNEILTYNKLSKEEKEILAKQKAEKDYENVCKAGGLRVIITEAGENIRVEDQMRGRAGRQGEPGSSKRYISAQDEFLTKGYDESYQTFLTKLNKMIVSLSKLDTKSRKYSRLSIDILNLISKQFDKTQSYLTGRGQQAREYHSAFDRSLNNIRDEIYNFRNRILPGEQSTLGIYSDENKIAKKMSDDEIKDRIRDWILDSIKRAVLPDKKDYVNEEYIGKLNDTLKDVTGGLLGNDDSISISSSYSRNQIFKNLTKILDSKLDKIFDDKTIDLRNVILKTLDEDLPVLIELHNEQKSTIGFTAFGKENLFHEFILLFNKTKNRWYEVLFEDLATNLVSEYNEKHKDATEITAIDKDKPITSIDPEEK